MDLSSLLQTLFQGMALGLAIAAPVGPIGILCIKRTLNQGWTLGLVSGLGAATADALYGSMAGLGWVAIAQALSAQRFWLQLGGGLVLIYLGFRTALARSPAAETGQDSGIHSGSAPRHLAAYGSTLGLTLANPATIFAFIALFAGLGDQAEAASLGQSLLMVFGVFGGSALWWLLLCGLIHRLRRQINPGLLGWINRIAGGALGAFGLGAIAAALHGA